MFIIIGYLLYIRKFSYTILSLGICVTLLHCVCGDVSEEKGRKNRIEEHRYLHSAKMKAYREVFFKFTLEAM